MEETKVSKEAIYDGTVISFMNEGYPCTFEFVDKNGAYGVPGGMVKVTTSPVVRVLKKISNPNTGGGYYDFLTKSKDGYHRYTIFDRRGE